MRRILAAMVTAMTAGAILVLAPPAPAQTGYPPPACSTAETVIDAGAHEIGSTFTIQLSSVCLWSPGTEVAVTVNGQAVGNKVVDADGTVSLTITVVSATELSVNPIVSAQCGNNTASGIGSSAAAGGANVRATANFRVRCPGDAPVRATRTARSGVAFTGANVLRWGGLAVALLAVGSLLVIGARRRRGASDSA